MRDSYFGAVTNKTRIFKDMIDAIDPASNTVVILLSDHGHVDRGGHGGTDEVRSPAKGVDPRVGVGRCAARVHK